MREIVPGIFTWGADYPDRPWELNGYGMVLDGRGLVIDPPAPAGERWDQFAPLEPITDIILTNRDHVRDAEQFRKRYGARVISGVKEVAQFASFRIDHPVSEGECIAATLRVIDLPGKSPGEIGLHFDPTCHPSSRVSGGIMLLGDALIGHPAGSLGLIPAQKVDDPVTLKQSLRKLLEYDFDVLLLCDGQPLLHDAKQQLAEFLRTL